MRILLVEDDELISKALEKILSSQNYVVDVATNGQVGWEFVEAFIYDLIILDIVLPKLDGIRFCQKLRESGSQIPVLLLTAQNSSNDKVMGLDAGADDYVVKPFELTELLARIRVLLRRSSSSVPVTLEWSSLCLDPGLCKVTYRGQLLNLTPKEYRLLELFLRNHHRVFSRSAILDHLWPCEQAPSEDAVTVHIKDLRQKLKRAGAPSNFIETVYGQGYRLNQVEAALDTAKSPKLPTRTPENLIYQRIQTELTTVWEKHKNLNQRRLLLLENASAQLLDNNLREEQRQEAQQIAHKLAGALGIFGFAEASCLARELEAIFEACGVRADLGQVQLLHLAKSLAALKEILEQSGTHLPVLSLDYPQRQIKAELGSMVHPLLLVIDDDVELVESVVRLAIAQGISIEQVKLSGPLNRESWTGNVVVLNFPLVHATARDLTLLAELANQTPPIPVLLLTAQNSLVNRVKVAHLAAHVCLQKPLLPEQVLEVIARVRSQIQAAAAKVMVVDDDANILTGMRTLLEPLGMRLTTLAEPHQFLPVLEKCSPDLLVLDLKMPNFNGVQLCQVLRNTPRWSGLPILFLTAHTDVGTINQIFAAGANEYISKTVGQSELATRILNTLERARLHRVFAHPLSS